jgi:antitoxin (DNA-binding transcriptional repressor) of toxin-antitoxin stability system
MGRRLIVSEAVRNFADYINRVAYRGESFTLVRGNKPVAELSPVISGRRLVDLPYLLDSLPSLNDADARAFADDISDAHFGLSGTPLRDPWES